MKLLLHSNAPWTTTGYGQQVALFGPRLAEHHDLAISSFYGLEGGRLRWNDIPVFPGLAGKFGNEVIGAHAEPHFGGPRDGVVLTLMDVWVLDREVCKALNVASWVPVDHDPAPPMVKRFFAETGAIPLAMSRFGEERLREYDPLYVPHGVDTKVYRPIDKREARKQAGLPRDAFVIGAVVANKGTPSRKSLPEILKAFKAFRAKHDDAILLMHTDMQGEANGINLPPLLQSLGLTHGEVCFSDQYTYKYDPVPPEGMAAIYSGVDVLLNPAKGEGFGLPVLEAQACGTPAIVTDFSAMHEVCGAGWRVEFEPEWTPHMAWQATPNVEDIVESLRHCYSMSTKGREQLGEKARRHALTYDADRVMRDHFLPALEAVEERFGAREPVTV